jgi:hypothetical protein
MLEQKVVDKAVPTPTPNRISPKTPLSSSETPTKHGTSFDNLFNKVYIMGKRVENHSQGMITHTKDIVLHTTRIEEQDKKMELLQQLVHDVEEKATAEKERPRQVFEAEKARTDGAMVVIKILTEQVAALQSQILPPPVDTAPAIPPFESQRRQSSQGDLPPKSAINDVQERVEKNWKAFVKNKTLINGGVDDISNKVVANETLVDARLNEVEHIANNHSVRIDSLDRTTNHGGQSIDQLDQDVKSRFETAIVHADARFLSNQNTFDKRITQVSNTQSTAVATLEVHMEEYAERSEKTNAMLLLLNQRMTDLETEKPSIEAILEENLASVKALNERVIKSESSHEVAIQAVDTASAKFNTLDTCMTDLEAAHNAV